MSRFLTINERLLDRILRVVIGLVLVGLAAVGSIGIWGYVGLIPLVTGIAGICPLYSVLGISTCQMRPGQIKH